jgi:uncharacterized membrane protein YeaQ/YmgE (transglycosylase-associated protein family)
VGFIVLLAIGAALGWAATIIARSDDGGAILASVFVGMAGALAGGVLASGESLLFGLTALALVSAIAGAALFLGAMHFARMRVHG